ncbi:ribonuclease HII [Patescibacteria group bacterium]|nr:ribonuclease HII [Patescibacteria group bacterium]
MEFPTFKNESQQLTHGYKFVAGCDEVGVSPLAGPVVAGACILNPDEIGQYRSKNKWYYRVRDSKTVNEDEREVLSEEIKAHCLAFGIGEASVEEIDSINIHHASLLAMSRAVDNMLVKLSGNGKIFLFLDGRFELKGLTNANISQKAIVSGDAKILSIAAASIVAKVYRDSLLKKMDEAEPQYGFAKHKGYNTKEHRVAIIKNGITKFHRRSFLKNIMTQKQY